MATAQQLFDAARDSYDHAQKLIKAVGETFREAESRRNGISTFDPEITMAEFDEILQGMLLTQALADGEFSQIERTFINLITRHGNLLGFVRYTTKGELDLSWDDIASMDGETQGKLVEVLPKILKRRCIDFLQPFIIIEKVVEDMDFMKELVADIVKIGACLAGADGKVEEIEAEGMNAMMQELLLKPWLGMRAAFDEEINSEE